MNVYAPDHIFSVSELTRNIKTILEEFFGRIWVCGEISNCRRQASGHIYCTLKDNHSQLSIVFFRSDADRLKFKLQDGLQVNVFGRISVYEKRGNYQFIVERAEPVGYGALQLAFEQLKRKLDQEGLFAAEHKRSLPLFPQRIGVVTSPTGAAIRDILHVLDRRFSTVEVVLYPSLVQGEGAAEQIAEGIRVLDALGNIDVIIVGRGGGSLEDLWAFNEEVVARALFACKTPVVSAVGHEIDFTISDFVADLRAPTPSAAAELVVQEREAVAADVARLRQALARSVSTSLDNLGHRLKSAVSAYAFRRPSDMLVQYEQQLDDIRERTQELQDRFLENLETRSVNLRNRLLAARPERAFSFLGQRLHADGRMLAERLQRALASREAELGGLAAKLDSLSPLAVLGRGYSIAYREPDKTIIRDSSEVSGGDHVRVKLHRGSLACTVNQVEQEGSANG
ncbi:MAG: exodeoxyribonuclease VII large subunit [Candidatus Abyssobacteria bacterium SURF_5]|uniref:Exodeoxyribonuclease 7 large subunit n=1 Tax=Abyssobacteria bacterium (strain SURF_5) TaxID=2093360 RepID=A0A3A4P5Y7_ABYX5|nr:MAG: exodeoxyribonuclease VII large subunit [Candidatus Abyssubacteria bacterium SURF_5]